MLPQLPTLGSSLPSLPSATALSLPSLGGSLPSLTPGVAVAAKAVRPLGAYQSEEEESMAMKMLEGGLSAVSYIGTQIDSIMGRRVRAGIALAKGQAREGTASELLTVPVLSDLFGWTDPKNITTGKDITGWDDDKRYLDDVAGMAVEMITDPTTWMTGGVSGMFGTSTKAGKIVERADVVGEVAKAMSAKLGRKVGRREALARATLRDINIPENTGDVLVDSMKKRLDDAAKGYGFDDFKSAQEADIGGQKLSAAWGFVKAPMRSTPDYVIEGGDTFASVQRKLDDFGNYMRTGDGLLTKHPLLRTWDSLFRKDVNEAKAAASQTRAAEMNQEVGRRKYIRTKKYADTSLRLQKLGLDKPEFQDDIRAATERQFYRRLGEATELTPSGQLQMDLHPDDRDVDVIVRELFDSNNFDPGWRPTGRAVRAGDHAQYKPTGEIKKIDEVMGNYVRFAGDTKYTDISSVEAMMDRPSIRNKYSTHGFSPEQIGSIREEVADYVREQARDSYDQIQRAWAVGIGPDQLADYQSAYASHFARPIDSAIGREARAPKFVTDDMRRHLTERLGMSEGEIANQASLELKRFGDVRGLWEKAYGKDRIEAAFKAQQELEAKGGKWVTPGSDFLQDIFRTGDKTFQRRLELLKNLPGNARTKGGVTAADALVMDSRVSGPMAGIWEKRLARQADGTEAEEWVFRATTPAERHDIIFREFFHGDRRGLDRYNLLRDTKRLGVGVPYGDMARIAGKNADDVIENETELRRLRELMFAEQHASEKSRDLVKLLHDVNPMHVLEQRPLFPDDAISGHLAARNGVEEAIAAAKAVHRVFVDTAANDLAPGQGESVIDAMRKAGIGLNDKQIVHRGSHARPAEALANYLRIAKEEGRTTFNIFGEEMNVDDMLKYLGENPGRSQFLKRPVPKDQWLEMQRGRRARGLGPKRLRSADFYNFEDTRSKILISFGLDEKQLSSLDGYDRGVAAAVKQLRKQMTARGRQLSTADKRFIMEEAKRIAARNATDRPLNEVAKIYRRNFDKFMEMKASPYSIPMTEFNDARNAMSLSRSPAVLQDIANFADKVMNTTKSHFTTTWIPFLTRNLQTLAWMDHLVNADDPLNPVEYIRMGKRWMDAYRFHAGRSIKGISSAPMFRDAKFKSVVNPEWTKSSPTSVPRMIPLTVEQKDEILTDVLRSHFAASEVANPTGVGELLQDRNLLGEYSAMPLLDTIPGVGRNVKTLGTAWETFSAGIRNAKEQGIDWQFINPLNVRGGFFRPTSRGGKRRSRYFAARFGEDVSSYSETIGRTATWLGQIYKGVDPLNAAARTNAAHVDYNSLSNFERQYMRRIVPFYTYQRKMIPYLMRNMLQHPGGPIANMVRTVNIASAERQGRFTPQQLQGQLAIPMYDKEGGVRAYLKPDLPVSILNNMFSVGGSAYETFQNTALGWLSQSHFMLKGGLELAFGRSTFQRGRDLEDLYSRIGVKDPILNQIVMTSPLGRYASNFGPNGIMFDERKTPGEKAFSFLTGQPIAHVDIDKATEEALDRALNKALSLEEGVGSTEHFYAFDEENLSPRAKALMRLRTTRSQRRLRESREREQ